MAVLHDAHGSGRVEAPEPVPCWVRDGGDIVCHPIPVLPFLQDSDVANARVGAERNPLKTDVNDLNAVPPEWTTDDVRSTAKISSVTSGSVTLGVAIGSEKFITDQLLSKADVFRALHERVQLFQDSQMEFAFLRESLGVSRINHILCEFMVTKSWRNKAQWRFTMKCGNDPSNGSSPVSRRTALRNRAQESARHRSSGSVGALIAAKP